MNRRNFLKIIGIGVVSTQFIPTSIASILNKTYDTDNPNVYKVLDFGESKITGRIYPESEVRKAASKFQDMINQQGYVFGELDSKTPIVDISRISHAIVDTLIHDNALYVEMKILKTPHGDILRALNDSGVEYRLSPVVDYGNLVRELTITKIDVLPI